MRHFFAFSVSVLFHIGLLLIFYQLTQQNEHAEIATPSVAFDLNMLTIKAPKQGQKPKIVQQITTQPVSPTIKPIPKKATLDKTPQKRITKRINHTKKKGRSHKTIKTVALKKAKRTNAIPLKKLSNGANKIKKNNDLTDAYQARLQTALSRIANRYYPRSAYRMHKQGTVIIRFRLKHDGLIDSIRLLKSSGNKALDKAALNAPKRLGKYQPPPDKIALSVTVPIRFRLK